MKWTGLRTAAIAACLLGALSTLGDWVWAAFIPDGAVLPGIVHGLVVFLALAMILGWAAGTRGATPYLLLRLPVVGLLIAALFYPLAGALGYLPALVASWVLMWLALTGFQGRAGGQRDGAGWLAVRGVVAAVASGLAFWAISGIWTDPSLGSTSYLLRFVLWTLAFFPGFAALLIRSDDKDSDRRPDPS